MQFLKRLAIGASLAVTTIPGTTPTGFIPAKAYFVLTTRITIGGLQN